MENGLRLLGETLSEGFALGRIKADAETGSRSFEFDYLNPVFTKWLGLSESKHQRLGGQELLAQGGMSELYQYGEVEAAVETGSPVNYKVFSMKLEGFLEVLVVKFAVSQFYMVVKKPAADCRDRSEIYGMQRINRFQAEAGLRFLVDNMTDVLWRLDEDFRFTYISASDKAMRDYEPEEVIGRSIWEFLTPDSVDAMRKYHVEVVSQPLSAYRFATKPKEIQMICRDGRIIWVEVNLTPVIDSNMGLDGFQGIARDITQNKQVQMSLVEYRHLMEAVLDNMAQAMIVINMRMEIAAYNKKFLDLFGFEASEVLVGTHFSNTFGLWRLRRQTNREEMEQDKGTIAAGRAYTREYWQIDEYGEKIWVQMFHNPLPGGGFVRTYSDITDRKRYELDLYASREKLAVIASTDELTGVLNRRSGFAMLRQMERNCIRHHQTFSVCFIDVDALKSVNDSHGHGEGDVFLKTTADFIRSSIRNGDSISRIGGDEFMVIFPGCEKVVAETLVSRIKDKLAEHGREMGKPYLMSFSYGIEQMSAEDPITLEELLRRADHLMYTGKRHSMDALLQEDRQ